MNVKAHRITRLALFKRVLSEAAKIPPLSPAFHAYKSASSDAERRDAYTAMTAIDRKAIAEDSIQLMYARHQAVAAEFRAAGANAAARDANRIATLRSAKAARIASLPAAARRLARFRSASLEIASYTGNSLGWLLAAIFILGNIASFSLSLIYQWSAWLLLVGACLSIYILVMLAVHRSMITSVLKALPAAISAAIYGDQSGQVREEAPNSAANQKAPLSGR